MNKDFKILGLILLLLLAFLFNITYIYASENLLLKVVPEKVIAVLELKGEDLMTSISAFSLEKLSKESGEEKESIEYEKAREEAREKLGFDILDPIFLENIFSEGVVLSCLGVSIGGLPEVLLAISPSDTHAFLKFIGAIEAKYNLKEEVSTYKGINLVNIELPEEAELEPLKTISYAFLGDIVVIGGNPTPVRRAIEVFKGEENSIFENSEYLELKAKAEEKVEFPGFFFCLFSEELYRVLDEIVDLIEEEEVAEALRNSRDSLEEMGNLSVIGGSLEKQYKAYMIAEVPEEYLGIFEDTDLSNLRSISMFPKNTFLYLGGLVPITWEEIKDEFLSEEVKADIEENLAQAQSKIGIDVEQTVYSWLTEEFSLGLFDTSTVFPKVGLITGYVSEEILTQNLYPVLQSYAPLLGGALTDREYEGVNYKYIPNPMFPLGYGIIEDRFVLSSGMDNIIDAQKGDIATIDKLEVIKYMLSYTNVISLFYLDMNSVTEVVNRFMQMGEVEKEKVEVEEREEVKAVRREAIMESLSRIKNILIWAGVEEDYLYTWLEVNYN